MDLLDIHLKNLYLVLLIMLPDIEGEAEIEKIGPPDKVISAFGPEVIGENVEGKVLSMEVVEHSGRTYYQFELEPPHVLITATAAGNRLYLFNVTGSGKHLSILSIPYLLDELVMDLVTWKVSLICCRSPMEEALQGFKTDRGFFSCHLEVDNNG